MLGNWIILTIFSSVFAAINRIIQKVLLNNKENDKFALSGIFQILVSIVFLIYTLSTNSFELPNLGSVWVSVVAMVVMYALGNLTLFMAFRAAEASEVAIILASSSLWSISSAAILLGEKIVGSSWIGVGLILLGLVIINYQKTDWHLSKGHIFAILAAILYGFAFTNDAFILGHYSSVPSYLVIAFFLPGLATLLCRPSAIRAIPRLFSNARSTYMIIFGSIAFALSAIAVFTAYKIGGPASLISPITQSSIIFTIIISYFFLGERDNILKKIFGTAAIILGVILLV
ncbi:MAG: EamA family transporter [bacterium]